MNPFVVDRSTFSTAAENMAYDEQLLTKPTGPILRWYEWTNPGITISYRQHEIPIELNGIDFSTRITGGGLLFHSPGDLVFTIIADLSDFRFERGLKSKLNRISAAAQFALADFGYFAVRQNVDQPDQNRAFCHTYQSPFELWVDGDKIVAMTLRKLRARFIVQGIFHLNSNFKSFNLDAKWAAYLSKGLSQTPSITELGVRFQHHLEALIK